MTRRDADEASGEDAAVRTEWGEPALGPRYAAEAARVARRGVESGAVAGVTGGAIVLWGVRALARGSVLRGLVRLVVGALLLGVAAIQRQPPGRPAGERIDVGGPGEDPVEPTE